MKLILLTSFEFFHEYKINLFWALVESFINNMNDFELISYNYQMVSGGKTDVVALKMRGLKIPVCNISCGYYNAHKNNEYTHFSELQNCLSFVKEILEKKFEKV